MKRRVLTVGLAVLLAVLGTVGVLIYVNQADVRAIAGQQAVTALIADRQLPAGTSAGDAQANGLLRSVTLPAASVPADAVTDISPDLGALVTSADIPAGQLLLRQMLVTTAQATGTGGLAIPPGMIAVSIKLCVPEGVAGHVRRGSSIAIFDTVVVEEEAKAQPACDGAHTEQRGTDAFTRVLLTGVKVLAVGASSGAGQVGSEAAQTTSATGAAEDSVLLTVAVNQADAEKLITLTQTGLPYLALLGEASEIVPVATPRN